MPTVALPHHKTPFTLPLRESLQLVRETAGAHEAAPTCEIERRGGAEALITLVVPGGQRVIELRAVAEGERTRIVDARMRVRALEWARWALERRPRVGVLLFAAVLFCPFGSVLVTVTLAALSASPPTWPTVLCFAFASACVLLFIVCRIIQETSAQNADNAAIEPLLKLFGRAGDCALVRPPLLRPKHGDPLARERDRTLRARPKTPIQSLHERETGTIVGRVCPASSLLRAPLSGRECVFWELRVSEAVATVDSAPNYLDRGDIRSIHPFCIMDESGWVPFDPTRADLSVQFDRVHEARRHTLSSRLYSLLTRSGVIEHNDRRDRVLRVEEAVLLKGQEVAAHGSWVSAPDLDGAPVGGYRALPPSRLRFAPTDRSRAILSSHPDCITS